MGQELQPYEAFRGELDARQAELFSILPKGVSQEAFLNTAVMAVKQQPELLKCDRRSLHKAVTQAARDGLLPDGKEAVILPQKEKVKDRSGNESWISSARYQPMTYGIRKRAREIEGLIIDAQVVRKNDKFVWVQGDDPRLIHEPAPLGTPRGELVGVYAIFKIAGEVIHREVMDREQVDAVKSISRNQKGLLWTTFEEEGWRKSVIRRGIKTVPLTSSAMRQIVEADDDLYDVGRGNVVEARPQPVLPPPPPAPAKAAPASSPSVAQVPPPPPPMPPAPAKSVKGKAAEPKPIAGEVETLEPISDEMMLTSQTGEEFGSVSEFFDMLREEMSEAGDNKDARDDVWASHEFLIAQLGRKDRVTAEQIYDGTEEPQVDA